jgi:hypothetical protein
MANPPDGYERVVFADDLCRCNGCDEPWCEKHQCHFFACECIGPDEDDEFDYLEVDGVMYAKRKADSQ